MSRVVYFTRFERFWHWAQALIILLLLLTGFEIHGSYTLFGFEGATDVHTTLAWGLIGLWVFGLFWHTVTGEWRQYVPEDADSVLAMMRYYAIGIFLGTAHPYHRQREGKHNPLQRMAYAGLMLLIAPAAWLSGLLYLFYKQLSTVGLEGIPLELIALAHTLAAFAMLAFLVVHLYLTLTTSEKPFAFLKEMITGYSEESSKG